jgi:hypothetical protein
LASKGNFFYNALICSSQFKHKISDHKKKHDTRGKGGGQEQSQKV